MASRFRECMKRLLEASKRGVRHANPNPPGSTVAMRNACMDPNRLASLDHALGVEAKAHSLCTGQRWFDRRTGGLEQVAHATSRGCRLAPVLQHDAGKLRRAVRYRAAESE